MAMADGEQAVRDGAGGPHATPGPLFVSGRQHSGNSMIVKILMQAEGCLGFIGDNGFIEQVNQINAVREPQERVVRAIEAMRFDENPDLGEATRAHLARWILDHPRADATAIYLEAMDHCVRVSGKRFWLQKATSYIFYTEEIFATIPGSKIIYLLRNPYDLVASRIRRHQTRRMTDDIYWSTVYGWRKGARLAEAVARRHPERFKIVQYERLVSSPDEVLGEVFDFAGYTYDRKYSEIPRVNTAERPYDWSGDDSAPRGLSPFKVNSYVTTLNAAQIRATSLLLESDVVERWYPGLTRVKESRGPITTIRALAMIAWHMALFARAQHRRYTTVSSRTRFLLDRTLRRLRA